MLGASMQEGEGGYTFWNKGGSFSAWVNGWLVEDCGAVIGEANVCMICTLPVCNLECSWPQGILYRRLINCSVHFAQPTIDS